MEDRTRDNKFGDSRGYDSSNIQGHRGRNETYYTNRTNEFRNVQDIGEMYPNGTNNTQNIQETNNSGQPEEFRGAVASTSSGVSTKRRQHLFRDPTTYKDFVPKTAHTSEEDISSIRSDGSLSRSSQNYRRQTSRDSFMRENSSGQPLPQAPRVANHSFLATIDSFLLVLEGTLASTYRISEHYTGPSIPMIVKNTMHSIRLSLETLRVHFGYTPQENFEPLASILRDMLSPAVDLITSICPELNPSDNPDFYAPLLVPVNQPTVPVVPKQITKPRYLVTPTNIHGTTVYNRHPVPAPQPPPRIPLFMNFSQDPNLGIFATPDGMLRLNLPFTFQIDITLDGAILMRNLRDKTFAAISACGTQCSIHSGLCRAHQHGKILDIRITDEFAERNMYAKIGVRGIKFGGTDTPSNLYLKDNGHTSAVDYNFRDLEHDFIKEVFIEHTNAYGPNFYEACRQAIQECSSKTLVDGSLHFYWRDIKVTQYRNGEITIYRNNRDFIIWCSPEFIHPYSGTEKKGVIKVVTPLTRLISTVMCTSVKQNEKFFLGNLKNNWVYYTTRDFIVSNEFYSAGYSTTPRDSMSSRSQSNSSNSVSAF